MPVPVSKTPVRAPAKAPTTAKAPVKPSTASKPPVKTPTTVTRTTPSTVAKTVPKPAAQSKPVQAKPAAAPAPAQAGNWINRTVQNRVAGVGSYAGGFVNSIGGSVNKVGEGVGKTITDTTRYWGQGVAGYGNNIKDSVGVGGKRVVTAGNPLGMAGVGSSGAGAPPGAAKKAAPASGSFF